MGDDLRKLPTIPDEKVDPTTLETLHKIFGEQKVQTVKQVCSSNMEVIAAGLLFALLNMSFVDDTIKKLYKNAADNLIILIIIKTIMFMILFFLINNFYLIKKE